MNVLFLAVSAGGGHLKAAESIQNYIEDNFEDSKTYIVDAYKYVSPIIDKLVIGGYLKTLKNSPKLWGMLYDIAEKGENVNDISKALNKILSFKIRRLVKQLNPDVIVCTHPFPLQMACNLKKSKKIDVPIINIMTDYASHSLWINEYVDAYIVANDWVAREMTDRGVSKDKIFSFGIPVGNKFLINTKRSEILNKYRLEDKTTLLIMGGSLGMGEIKKLFVNLLKSARDFQLIIVCGNNAKLKKQLEKAYIKSVSSKRAVILGFSNEVHELMSVSDLLISKPGGLTITEALLMKLPIVILSPIPGQEEKNASFLLNSGLGVRPENVNSAERVISQCLDNPLRIKQIKEMAAYLAKPNSTRDIANLLRKLSEKKSTI